MALAAIEFFRARPPAEPSFLASCVDAMIKVPDELSLAAMRCVTQRLGKRVGGATGTNFFGVLAPAQRMREAADRLPALP